MIRAIRQSFSHPSSARFLFLSLFLSTRFHPPSECLALTEKDEARVPRVFAGRWKRPAFSDLLSLPAQSAARSFPPIHHRPSSLFFARLVMTSHPTECAFVAPMEITFPPGSVPVEDLEFFRERERERGF